MAGPQGSVGLQIGIPKTPLAFTAQIAGSDSYVRNRILDRHYQTIIKDPYGKQGAPNIASDPGSSIQLETSR